MGIERSHPADAWDIAAFQESDRPVRRACQVVCDDANVFDLVNSACHELKAIRQVLREKSI
ncbi:hypothetical protein J2Z31_004873 [Sinorhizobium kostiense]|uniref:Uncharacterized protein n=1 Tax=Sinorhizobium kostiense TaxID=76747 RepID=A0ABS4R618_9HYPH|nr:hypothetical protein [Sinorhizobium kostiense]MBP2238336.1 hypothetical protein [Sinorhizobium kostiense]